MTKQQLEQENNMLRQVIREVRNSLDMASIKIQKIQDNLNDVELYDATDMHHAWINGYDYVGPEGETWDEHAASRKWLENYR